MNFKSIGFKAAIAASVVTGVALAVSPAQALTFGSQLDINWSADASPTAIDFNMFNGDQDGPGGADIGQFVVSAKTGSFTSLPTGILGFTTGFIKDLTSIPVVSSVNNFLFFQGGSPFNFNLTSFALTSDSKYSFTGVFADNTFGSGELTTQVIGTGIKSYSATLTAGNAVPTPALLPGLIALGVGVLRKRKSETAEKVGVDA